MLIMVKTKARRGKGTRNVAVLEPEPEITFSYVTCGTSPKPSMRISLCIMPRCDFALEKLTTLFRKALRQATRHPAQPDASVRQVSVSISVAAPASAPALLSLSDCLSVAFCQFV